MIVAYLLKARTVVPEQQLLLTNGSETTSVSRQRLSKHVPTTTDKHATIYVLLETVFFARFMQMGYKEVCEEKIQLEGSRRLERT
jgi:hypothetical protein